MSAAAIAGIGAAAGVAGALYTGRATSDTLGAQAEINEANAELALEQGDYNSFRQGMKVSQHLGAIRAAYGGSGVAAGSGSVLAVLQASAMNGELDRQNIIHGAQVRAINYRNEAVLERAGASNAMTASYLNALASFGGSGARAFGQSASSYTPDVGTAEAGESDAALTGVE